MLSGLKGSGKSLITALVINDLITNHGAACIRVTSLCNGQQLEQMIGDSDQLIILDFDEYDKIFAKIDTEETKGRYEEVQNSFLTLLSGGVTRNLLSLFQVNDSRNINDFFKNRPNRVFYTLNYKGLTRDVIRAFAEDVLPAHKARIYTDLVSRIHEVSFDIMISIAEEVNRYDCAVEDAMRMMGFGDVAEIRMKRVLLYKGMNVSLLYDTETLWPRLAAGATSRLDRRAYDEDDYTSYFGKSPLISYNTYSTLPAQFLLGSGLEDFKPLGETEVALTKTSDPDMTAFVYPPSMLQHEVYDIISAYCKATCPSGMEVGGNEPEMFYGNLDFALPASRPVPAIEADDLVPADEEDAPVDA